MSPLSLQLRQATANPPFSVNNVSALTIAAVAIVNPVFEEVFVCGYVVTVLRKASGFWPAIHVSVGLRLLYHLYQGPLGVIGIIPIGLVFAYWFAWTGRLWPVVVAHSFFDFSALAAYSQH